MEHWSYFNAWCLTKGLRPFDYPPWDLCDIIQFWLFEGLSDESADRLETNLIEPPPNISPEILAEDPIWSAEAEMEMFQKMMG